METPSSTILIKKQTHRGRDIILLEFYGRHDWLTLVKSLPQVKYSRTWGFWYLPYDRKAYNTFLELGLPYIIYRPQVAAPAATEVPASDLDRTVISSSDRRASVHPASGSKGADIQSTDDISVTWNAGKFVVRVPYKPDLIKIIKDLEGSWWHQKEKVWICKDTLYNLESMQKHWELWSSEVYNNMYGAIASARNPCKIKLYYTPSLQDKVCVELVGYGANHQIIKSVTGRTYHKDLKLYSVPADRKITDHIIERYMSLGYKVENRLSEYQESSQTESRAQKVSRFLKKVDAKRYACIHKMAGTMLSQGYGVNTIKSYGGKLMKLMDFYTIHDISSIRPKEVQEYIDKMARRGWSFSLINQLHSAVVYYFSRVEPTASFELNNLKRPKGQKKLPKFLSKNEVARLFEQIDNLKHLAMVYVLYGSGLRRGELVSIKLKDIYWDRSQILIVDGKGGKDRMVNLGAIAKTVLETYFHTYKPQTYLFEGTRDGYPYSASSVSKIIGRATRKAGIQKRVTPHMLRHSFATHLMDSGIALPKIQKLLGHKDVKTTMIYTHVTTDNLREVISPLDMLKKEDK